MAGLLLAHAHNTLNWPQESTELGLTLILACESLAQLEQTMSSFSDFPPEIEGIILEFLRVLAKIENMLYIQLPEMMTNIEVGSAKLLLVERLVLRAEEVARTCPDYGPLILSQRALLVNKENTLRQDIWRTQQKIADIYNEKAMWFGQVYLQPIQNCVESALVICKRNIRARRKTLDFDAKQQSWDLCSLFPEPEDVGGREE